MADTKPIDKKNPIYPEIGSHWFIRNVQSRPELTGMLCTIADGQKGKQRIKVKIDEGDFKGTTATVKLSHLVSEEEFDKCLLKFAKEATDNSLHNNAHVQLQKMERRMKTERISQSFRPKISFHLSVFFLFFTSFTYLLSH